MATLLTMLADAAAWDVPVSTTKQMADHKTLSLSHAEVVVSMSLLFCWKYSVSLIKLTLEFTFYFH